MASGVGVKDECLEAYEEIKMGHRWLYIIYRLTDDLRKVMVEEKAGLDKSYQDFVDKLKEAESKRQCRYAIFDVKFFHGDVPQQRLAFFLWSPDTATVRQKMLYSSSKQAFLRKLQGMRVIIQCNDDTDLAMSNVLDRCISKYN
ncbi:cofilin-like [Gigantopelta aegis]|uniref:cofilin-like n=1 Tax=Gigantopelta aegis TaxID=1735272 RepID=UPI001B88CCAD|nr:cofilin-like [Gigantopelta aegis]